MITASLNNIGPVSVNISEAEPSSLVLNVDGQAPVELLIGSPGPKGEQGDLGNLIALSPLAFDVPSSTLSLTESYLKLSGGTMSGLFNVTYGDYTTEVGAGYVYAHQNNTGTNPNPYGVIYPNGLEIGDGIKTTFLNSQGLFIPDGGEVRFGDGSIQITAAFAPDLTPYATNSSVDIKIANLVNSAPATLDTLGEIATALGNDANLSTTLTNLIGTKADATATANALSLKSPLDSPVFTGDPKSVTPATSDNDTSIATTAFVKAQGYATESALTSYAYPLGSNPAGYLVASSLNGYATTSDLISYAYPLGSNPSGYLTAETLPPLDYLPLAGGTMSGAIVFDPVGQQNIAKGSFDSGRGGYNGISLNCAVGYELNWQAGYLRAKQIGGGYTDIKSESQITFPDMGSGINSLINSEAMGVQNSTGYSYIDQLGSHSNFQGTYLTSSADYKAEGLTLTNSDLQNLNLNITGLSYSDDSPSNFNLNYYRVKGNRENNQYIWELSENGVNGVSGDNTFNLNYLSVSGYNPDYGTWEFGVNGLKFVDGSTQMTAAIAPDLTPYLTQSSAASTYLSQSSAASTYFPIPTGDASQYLNGAGTPVTFPTVTSVGKMVTLVYNGTGSTITKGAVIYISGSHGNDPQVSLARADTEATSAYTLGVAESVIPNNSTGNMITVGILEGMATNSYSDGTALYLSSTTAGALSSEKQFSPNHYVKVGTVIRSHPTLGTIYIKVENGFQLDELSDCFVTAPANNNALVYESSTGLWKDKSVSTALGYAPANQTLSNLSSVTTARSSLGLGSMALETASNYLTGTTASATYLSQSSASSTYLSQSSAASIYTTKANNLSDLASASISRANLGLGSSATSASTVFAQVSNNLSDVTASTARTNLGLSYSTDAQAIAGTSASTVMTPSNNKYIRGSRYASEFEIGCVSFGTYVSGGTVVQGAIHKQVTSTATSGNYAGINAGAQGISILSLTSNAYTNFDKEIQISFRLYLISPVANNNAVIRIGLGKVSAAIGDLTTKGFYLRRQGTSALELCVHNGTSLFSTTSSYNPGANEICLDVKLVSTGTGTAYLYINNALVATNTNAPTGLSSVTGYQLTGEAHTLGTLTGQFGFTMYAARVLTNDLS